MSLYGTLKSSVTRVRQMPAPNIRQAPLAFGMVSLAIGYYLRKILGLYDAAAVTPLGLSLLSVAGAALLTCAILIAAGFVAEGERAEQA